MSKRRTKARMVVRRNLAVTLSIVLDTALTRFK